MADPECQTPVRCRATCLFDHVWASVLMGSWRRPPSRRGRGLQPVGGSQSPRRGPAQMRAIPLVGGKAWSGPHRAACLPMPTRWSRGPRRKLSPAGGRTPSSGGAQTWPTRRTHPPRDRDTPLILREVPCPRRLLSHPGQAGPARRRSLEHDSPARRPSPEHDSPARHPSPEHDSPARHPSPGRAGPDRRPSLEHDSPARHPSSEHDSPGRHPDR
jgi:hypothetical protein